jgi:hypothetical protein
MEKVVANTTTTGTTFLTLLTRSVTITSGGILLLNFTVSGSSSAVNKVLAFRFFVDAVQIGGLNIELKSADTACSGAYVDRVAGLSVGAHTVTVEWATSATGTGQIRPVANPNTEHGNMLITEVGA